MRGALWRYRYLLLRRLVQLGILVLFWGTLHRGWTVAGAPILRGDLSASELFGLIPLADPFAVLQILLAGNFLETRVLIGAAVVLLAYALIGGRSFCAWVCPINPVTDLAGWLRTRLGIKGSARLHRGVRFWALGLALVLSLLIGVAAFEWISPIGMVGRSLIFGMGTFAPWALSTRCSGEPRWFGLPSTRHPAPTAATAIPSAPSRTS